MSLTDELLKLDELRRRGALSDEEFARAKAALLAPGEELESHISDQLAAVRYQNELTRIDREWQIEREKYFVASRYGRRQIPTAGMGIGTALVGGVFGTIWTVMAVAITGSAPNFGPFAIAKFAFPLFGVAFTFFGIGWGIYCYNRAADYQRAEADYRARRQAIRPEQYE